MKTQALIVILLLLCTAIFASEDSSNAAEYERKTRELNQLAERFKAETGYVGKINYGYQRMRLGSFEGNFPGVSYSTEGDTIAFRQACEQIVEKILPFSPANRMQLSMSRISKSVRGYTTDYIQQVGGYRVEGSGFIMITSDSGRKHFSIGDNTVCILDDYVMPVFTNEDAVNIYYSTVPDDELLDMFQNRHPKFKLRYCNIYEYQLEKCPEYRLCWVGGASRKLVIDSVSGEIYVNELMVVHSVTVNANGTVLLDSDNNGSMDVSSKVFHDTRVSAECDGDERDQYTDIHGNTHFEGEIVSNIKAYLESSITTMFDGSSNPANQFIEYPSDPLNPIVIFDYFSYVGNPGNQYYHSINYVDWLCNSLFSTPFQYPHLDIVTGCSMPEQGKYFHLDSIIKINRNAGMYSSTICHEMTHALVYHQLNRNFMNPFLLNVQNEMLYGGMDEAFSFYYPCAYRNDATVWYPTRIIELSDLLTVTSVHNNTGYTPSNTILDENFYSYYGCREPIASAWWSLRGNSLFPSSEQGVAGIDTLLVAGLKIVKRDIDENVSYRYKPRYFYNILMNQVADGSASNSLNPKQIAIDKAYTGRGLHFTPQVISAGVSNPPNAQDKNRFRIGDPVYVRVANCPQNTPLTVYVVEDQDYTDGMNISALNAVICQVSGTSDNYGNWVSNSPVMTASAVGDYDILVDIGNNEVLHFEYIAANVLDGFDGLYEPGFTVYDDGIDVVLALDVSESMDTECVNLQKLTRTFISAMVPGDKINIFGFNEGNPPNWNGGFTNLPPTSSPHLYPLTSSNQASFINSVGLPTAEGRTDLYIPFLSGLSRFGESTERKEGMVLLSDGHHYPTVNPDHPYDTHHSNPHKMYHVRDKINLTYNPRGIECHTMRLGNIADGIQNMRDIASWGHGIAYQASQVSDMPLIVSRLINHLRGIPPSYENNHSIPRYSNQSLQIVVDDLADHLQTTLIWNSSGNPAANLFTLTSPSGVLYNQPECYGTSTLKYSIDAPESGV